MDIIITKNCVDCPFMSDTFACCELKAKLENRTMCQDDEIICTKKGYEIPLWCPLSTSDVTIKLKRA